MACRESSLEASNHRRNNSDELDVFKASRYFSGCGDVVLISSNLGEVQDPRGYRASLPDKDARPPNSRGTRKSLDVPMMRAHAMENGTNVIRAGQDRVSKDKILRQPSSPGGKIMNFMKSLFNPSSSAEGIREKKVKRTTLARSLKDRDVINPGGWRRSSIGHFRTSSAVAYSKSLPSSNRTVSSFSYIHSGSRTPSCTTIDVPWNDSRILPDHREAAISISIRNKAREEVAKWKVSCTAKGVRDSSDLVVNCDDDGNESDSSSDLFELPVYNWRSSMSAVSAGSAFMEVHV